MAIDIAGSTKRGEVRARSRCASRILTLLACLVALPSRGLANPIPVKVVVSGVDEELERNARLSVGIGRIEEGALAERIQALHALAPEEIRRALEPFGFYRSSVRSDLRRENGQWIAEYEVEAGDPALVRRIDLTIEGEGRGDPGFSETIRQFPLSVGDVLLHAAYESGKRSLAAYAVDHGYFEFAFLRSKILVDAAANVGDIEVHLATGPRYRFGEITFDQDLQSAQRLVHDLELERGDFFDTLLLRNLQEKLAADPAFEAAEVRVGGLDAALREVPIEVLVRPAKPRRWSLGAGYGTDTGFRLRGGVEFRGIQYRGHGGAVEFLGSEREARLSASYSIHRPPPRADGLRISITGARSDPLVSSSVSGALGMVWSRTRDPRRESIGLVFLREDYVVGPDKGIVDLLTPEASWAWARSDDLVLPGRGWKLQLAMRAAHEAVLSDTSFAQIELDAGWIHRFASGFRVLLRGNAGFTETSHFRDLPVSLRFFAGGDRSVRGFRFKELGPKDEEGDSIGGNSLIELSAEVDYFLSGRLERWGVAAFFDAGNALDDFSGRLERGAGCGVRWASPVGLVRLDVAWALSRPDEPLLLHFVFGPGL